MIFNIIDLVVIHYISISTDVRVIINILYPNKPVIYSSSIDKVLQDYNIGILTMESSSTDYRIITINRITLYRYHTYYL